MKRSIDEEIKVSKLIDILSNISKDGSILYDFENDNVKIGDYEIPMNDYITIEYKYMTKEITGYELKKSIQSYNNVKQKTIDDYLKDIERWIDIW